MLSRRCALQLAGLGAALGAFAHPAQAREAMTWFSIPEQSRETALLALGRQARVSLGFAPAARCGGRAGVDGRMTLEQALERLLDGSNCTGIRVDARTVVIRRRASVEPAPRPAPAARPAQPTQIDEIVVTADKTERLLSAAPYGLTAVSGQELQRRGVTDVHDLSLIAAGVTVTNLGPGRDKVLLRGLSDGPLTGHTQSTVGLYLGDLRLTYNAPDPDLPLIDVARVEVLRGPQGSLYGAGSIGGILKVTPNAPDLDEAMAHMSAGLSATTHGALSSSLHVTANLPRPDGGAALRLAAWSEGLGGYLDEPSQGLDNTNRSRRRGARLSGRWQMDSDLAVDLMLLNQSITTRDAHYVDPAQGRRARPTTTPEPHDNDFLAAVLTARWSPAWGRLTMSVGALDHDVVTNYDATGASAELLTAGARGRSFRDENEIRSLMGEIQLSSVGAGRFHWTMGAFASLGDQRLDATLTSTIAAGAYVEHRGDRLDETALFGEISYDLTPEITATAGGRVFRSGLTSRSTLAVGSPVVTFEGRTRQTGVAPKVLLAYRPMPGLTLYAQVAEGYRTAGFNTGGPAGQRFGQGPGDRQPLRRYSGDELWSYETGVRWTSADLGLAVRIAAFQAMWHGVQSDLILPSGLAFTGNLGDGQSRGIEVEGAWTRGRLSVGGNLVRQDPELLRGDPGLTSRSDAGLPGVAQLAFAANVAYRVDLPGDHTLDLTAGYAWVGHSRLALDSTTVAAMGGYGDLRLAANLLMGRTDIRIFVDNALNRYGDTLAFGNPFTYRTARQATPQRPRSVGVRIGRDF